MTELSTKRGAKESLRETKEPKRDTLREYSDIENKL